MSRTIKAKRRPSRGPVVTVHLTKETSKMRIEKQVFEEAHVSGFAHLDQEVAFFTQVAALLRPDDIVLDFGAGRGEFFFDEPSLYRCWLQNFRGRCAHVDGCDVDKAVFGNPTLDCSKMIEPGRPLPYEDCRFDLVVSRYVFEHLRDPEWAARELLRVTKPGGWICALTTNKFGYVALGARLTPNVLHARFLRGIQPHRKEVDVFPTTYHLNTATDVRRHFQPNAEVYHYRAAGVPSYHFGSVTILRLLLLLQRAIPAALYPGLALFIHKVEGSDAT